MFFFKSQVVYELDLTPRILIIHVRLGTTKNERHHQLGRSKKPKEVLVIY
jgi:hypothetical protein